MIIGWGGGGGMKGELTFGSVWVFVEVEFTDD